MLPFYAAFGRHESGRARDDACRIFVHWEFMSTSPLGAVDVASQGRDNARAGYVYIVMAASARSRLLLAFGPCWPVPPVTIALPSSGHAHPKWGAGGAGADPVLSAPAPKAGWCRCHVWLTELPIPGAEPWLGR